MNMSLKLQISENNGKLYINLTFIYDSFFVSSVLGKLNYHILVSHRFGVTADTLEQT